MNKLIIAVLPGENNENDTEDEKIQQDESEFNHCSSDSNEIEITSSSSATDSSFVRRR